MQIGQEDKNFKVPLGFERGLEVAREFRSDPPLLIIGIVRAVVEADCAIGNAVAIKDSLDVATTIRTACGMAWSHVRVMRVEREHRAAHLLAVTLISIEPASERSEEHTSELQ